MPDLNDNHIKLPDVFSLRSFYQLAVLAAVVLIVFSPGIYAEYCLVDDTDAVSGIMSDSEMSLKTIFIPGVKEGGYYRPLIGLSQYLDKVLWGMNTQITHLENILLHVFNVCCLFCLVRITFPEKSQISSEYTAFLTALLFAVHPVVTESVFWYSGRTDLLATALIMPALCALMVWQKAKGKNWLLVLTSVLLLLALLSKESALAIILVLPLFFVSSDSCETSGATQSKSWRIYAACLVLSLLIAVYFFKFIPAVILMAVCFAAVYVTQPHKRLVWHSGFKHLLFILTLSCAVSVFFISIRKIAFQGSTPRIIQTLNLMFQDLDYTIGLFIGAVGFYVKKYFMPLPLNFTIREIDPLYQLLGVIVLFGTIACFWGRSKASIYALVGLILLTPALPFVFGTISWTSYAERYMYLTTAFWSVATVLATEKCRHRKSAMTLLTVAVLIMAVVSFQRGRVWQTNIGILGDTVKKAPGFRDIRAFYMLSLYSKGYLKEAEEQYRVAISIPSIIYNPHVDLVYARVLYQQGRTGEALNLLAQVDKKTGGRMPEVESLRKSYLK